MRRRGLFIMSLGFVVIMSSPASAGATDIRTGLLVLGLTVVIVGYHFYRKDKKAAFAQEAAEKAKKLAEEAKNVGSNASDEEKVTKK
ncbi:hypothetical protein [Lapidilactobacillus gannanensis]|jgi:cbb3-type cytochrome oxidase subunit 3|uniref:Uncharacterized protein n=1 Tax=Lapidilactobacillus gannanensis TaxID=2486002 RepID=A0ABW4BNB7_9LACO|nr:hypothetical protein [Lapidilactobacillus gannanensis]MCH4057178.1 hypothetical protein [Lactobacillaceae bacterium]